MSEYEDVLRAAACGTVYVSRSTDLSGDRKTVSWRTAKKLRTEGMVKFANTSPDWLILTGGRTYLENSYLDRSIRGKKEDDGSPEAKADRLVSMLRGLGLKSAMFAPKDQIVGMSLENWDRLLMTAFRKPDGFPLLSTLVRLAKKLGT